MIDLRGLLPAALVFLFLAGCATFDRSACGRFEQDRQSMRYDTLYRYSENDSRAAAANFKPRKTSDPAAVRWYTLRLNTPEIRSCEHLYLYKEMYLQRGRLADATFEEIREFYTGGGQRVATKKENVTRQLKETGYYSAAVPLPIPESAPAGPYRVVSRLVLRANGRETVLATASAEFRVTR